MEITQLNPRPEIEQNNKLNKKFIQFESLLNVLRSRELPAEITVYINNEISLINSTTASEKVFEKQVSTSQAGILKLLEKELKLVTKNHYRNLWLPLGMSTFGLPLGVAFGLSLGNMAFLGIGLPIGMAIGVAVGTSLDKKAEKNETQLDIEIKH
ncbi:hypothetical protein [Pontibacter fetidus]|uniref:Uncharacterized protein n=1 Tax=Pontibacter fetidus TaxID=2700082 RepID=A0A6B2H5I1_9BACT|nr:hypothetical protein [Pontibacter fetidus]NDK55050.1 hypothetical protein [Pontibacter fetidus]